MQAGTLNCFHVGVLESNDVGSCCGLLTCVVEEERSRNMAKLGSGDENSPSPSKQNRSLKQIQAVDELVQSVTLHTPRPLLLHGYVFPFLILYPAWLYCWLFVYGVTDHLEAGFTGLSALGVLQVLISLFCHWSVHVRCFLTCGTVSRTSRVEQSANLTRH